MNAETKHSGPADVLVVLDRSAERFREDGYHESYGNLVEARAAVAELIERDASQRVALDLVDKVLIEFEGMTGAGYRYMSVCIRAALANVGGAK